MKYLELRIRNERWVAYPFGMRFPAEFKRNYPFRGRGLVSKLLFIINRLGADRFVLRTTLCDRFEKVGLNDVAYFWPSGNRSKGRFYGYRVNGDVVVEYLKLAETAIEKKRILREVNNVAKALAIQNRSFEVPRCIGVEEYKNILVARYEPLPTDATSVPTSQCWYEKVDGVRKQIAKAGYSHGDFSWHNIKTNGQQLWVLDWEEMRQGVDPLIDKVSLEFGYRIYWKHQPLASVMKSFDNGMLGAVRDLASRGISPGAIMLEHLAKVRNVT